MTAMQSAPPRPALCTKIFALHEGENFFSVAYLTQIRSLGLNQFLKVDAAAFCACRPIFGSRNQSPIFHQPLKENMEHGPEKDRDEEQPQEYGCKQKFKEYGFEHQCKEQE